MKTTFLVMIQHYFGQKLYNSNPIDIKTESKQFNFQKHVKVTEV